MDRNTALVGLVLAAVVAGCTTPGTGGGGGGSGFTMTPNDGLSLSFSTAQSTFAEGDDIVLKLDIENTGEATATDIDPDTSGADFVIDKTSSDNCNEQSPIDSAMPALPGVIESAQQAGGQQTVTWRCPYPSSVDLDEGVTDSFDATVTVTYVYNTTVRAPITVEPADEFEGGGSPVNTENSAAPVHVTVDASSPRPGGQRLELPVTVQNVGDGEVSGSVKIHTASIRGGQDLDCQGESVDLVTGSRSLVCATSDPVSATVERDLTIEMELGYTYEEQESTSFTIRGLPGSP